MRHGEVWARADQPAHALILSSDMYNNAATGRVVICPVYLAIRSPSTITPPT